MHSTKVEVLNVNGANSQIVSNNNYFFVKKVVVARCNSALMKNVNKILKYRIFSTQNFTICLSI